MNRAAIKFESFAGADRSDRMASLFSRAQVDEAYQHGYGAGVAAAQRNDAASLTGALNGLARTLAEDEARSAALRDQAVRALLPILTEMLEAMAPKRQGRRLEEALAAELRALARASAPTRCQITCDAALRPMVERCAAEAGLADADITDAPGDAVCVAVQGGRIEFSHDEAARQIRQLIAEIQEDGHDG